MKRNWVQYGLLGGLYAVGLGALAWPPLPSLWLAGVLGIVGTVLGVLAGYALEEMQYRRRRG